MERIYKRKILILFLVSLFLRIIFILTLKNHFYFDDEYEYYKMVKNFLSGNGLIVGENLKSFRPPLYPLLLSLLYSLNFNLFLIRVIQCLISSATVIFIYFLGKKVFNEKTGLISGIISTFYPFFIFYNGFLLTETLFVFLVVVSIYYYSICLISEEGKLNEIKTGILWGLSGLCRPTMETFFPFAMIYLLLLKEIPIKKRLKKIVLISLFFIFTISPWVIRNYVIFKKLIPGTTMGGWVFWEGNNPKSDGGPCSYFPENILQMEELARDKFLYRKTIEVIKQNPSRFAYLLKNKFVRFWNITLNASDFQKPLYKILSIISFGFLLPFFLIGFFITFKNKNALIMHLLIIFFTLFHMVFLASIRYRVAIEPFYIIFASYGIYRLTLYNRGG